MPTAFKAFTVLSTFTHHRRHSVPLSRAGRWNSRSPDAVFIAVIIILLLLSLLLVDTTVKASIMNTSSPLYTAFSFVSSSFSSEAILEQTRNGAEVCFFSSTPSLLLTCGSRRCFSRYPLHSESMLSMSPLTCHPLQFALASNNHPIFPDHASYISSKATNRRDLRHANSNGSIPNGRGRRFRGCVGSFATAHSNSSNSALRDSHYSSSSSSSTLSYSSSSRRRSSSRSRSSRTKLSQNSPSSSSIHPVSSQTRTNTNTTTNNSKTDRFSIRSSHSCRNSLWSTYPHRPSNRRLLMHIPAFAHFSSFSVKLCVSNRRNRKTAASWLNPFSRSIRRKGIEMCTADESAYIAQSRRRGNEGDQQTSALSSSRLCNRDGSRNLDSAHLQNQTWRESEDQLSPLRLLTYPDPKLRLQSEAVLTEDFGHHLSRLVEEMDNLLRTSQAVGIAAPQVGINKRVILMNVDPLTRKERTTVLINPTIVRVSKKTVKLAEGCLSLPGLMAELERPEHIEIEYQDVEGETIKTRFSQWQARVAQHEVDHLNGVLFIDRYLQRTGSRGIKAEIV